MLNLDGCFVRELAFFAFNCDSFVLVVCSFDFEVAFDFDTAQSGFFSSDRCLLVAAGTLLAVGFGCSYAA